MNTPAATSAVIIGAGPYGLSAAAHLRARGVQVRTFGSVMAGWREHMPVGMFLKSTPNASSLSAPVPGFTLADFCTVSGTKPLREDQIVPIDLFIRYGQWFQEHLVPDVEPAQVCQLDRSRQLLHIKLDSGEELETETVVVASGMTGYPYLPPELMAVAPAGPSPDGLVSHSSQHRDLSALAGQEVAVIGAGQSALESAALLHEAGARVQVIARGRVRFGDPPGRPRAADLAGVLPEPDCLGPGMSLYLFSHAPGMFRYLPRQTRLSLVKVVLGPSGGWWLRDRVVGQFQVRTGQRVQEARRDGKQVVLTLQSATGEQSDVRVDHVLAATGYRVNLDGLDFLSPGLRTQLRRVAGWPRLSASFESTVPGVFFVGPAAAATFGPLMRFVCGTGFAARQVSATIADRTGR